MTREEKAAILAELDRRKSGRNYVPHEPTTKQRQFLSLGCSEALYGGAAGGGKSDALLMAYFGDDKDPMRFIKTPGYAGLILRRTYADLSLPGAIMDRAHDWLASSGAQWNDKTKTWTFPIAGGAAPTLTFGYLENTRDHFRYQGSELQFCGFDELTQFNERQYLYLFSRLRRGKAQSVPLRMRAATNPGGIGHKWVYERFIERPEDRVFVPALLDDNPHLDRASYEEALAKLDPVTRDQLRSGSWLSDASLLVYRFDAARNTFDTLPAGKFLHVLGVDFGFEDEFVIAVLAFSETRPEVYVVDLFAQQHMTPTEWAATLEVYQERYKPLVIVGDAGALGKAVVEDMERNWAIPIKAAEKQKKPAFIRLLNGDLQDGRLKVKRGLSVAEQMELLQWHPDHVGLKEHPDMPNDQCDGVLYAWRECSHHMNAGDPKKAPAPGSEEWRREQAERMKQGALRRTQRASLPFDERMIAEMDDARFDD
jgi:hypothetical protein